MLERFVAFSRGAGTVLLLVAAAQLAGGCLEKPAALSAEERADEAFAAGAERQPTPRTMYSMARILEKKGEHIEHRRVLARIVHEYPQFMPAYNDLAKSYLRGKAPREAAQTLLAGLTVSPKDPVLLNNLGMCWLEMGDNAKALECFQKAATSAGTDAPYRSNMAVALGMMGRYDESLALFMQVVPRGEAHHNLAVLCEARHDGAMAAQQHQLAEQFGGPRSKS